MGKGYHFGGHLEIPLKIPKVWRFFIEGIQNHQHKGPVSATLWELYQCHNMYHMYLLFIVLKASVQKEEQRMPNHLFLEFTARIRDIYRSMVPKILSKAIASSRQST